MQADIVVTRHEAYKQYFFEKGVALPGTPVYERVRRKHIRGKVVAGTIPLCIASEAKAVIYLPVAWPDHLREKEMTIQQLRKYALPMQVYRVDAENFEEDKPEGNLWEQGIQKELALQK